MATRRREVWKASLFLWLDQREDIEDLAYRIRKVTGHRPTQSEIIRACLDAGLEVLGEEAFDELADAVAGKADRGAAPIAERWLRERLRREAVPAKVRSKRSKR